MSDAIGELKDLLLELRGELGRLKDLESIKNLITSYARGCDRGNDPAILAPLFS